MGIGMLKEALQYLKQGLSVVPTRPDTKMPYIPWTEYQARLPKESEVVQWFTKDYPKANVGFITGLISGIVVIDIDSAKGRSQLLDIVPDSLMFPIAESPRGGEHWYFRCIDPNLQTKVGIEGFEKVDIRANGGFIVAPPSIGGNGKPYKWRVDISEVTPPWIPEELLSKLPHKHQPKQIVEQETSTVEMFSEGRRDVDLFYTACTLVRGKMSQGQVYQVLLKLCLNCTPPMDLKVAEQKVNSAIRTAMEQPRDLKTEIGQWCLSQDGSFKIDSCFRELALQTKEQLAESRKVIADLSSRGIVEKDKGIGVYRLVDKQIELITIPDTMPEPMDLRWPFGIESWVDIYPGNVAVIAGTSNAGKSIFCINFARNNMKKHKVRYFSSEMDGQELKMRISGFEGGINDLVQNVEWVRRSSDWWDLILPDGINIIDYMEIYENFYLVGEWIKKVFNKLKGGMALIALQKKDSNTEEGRGGALTKEKARLYMSLNYGNLKIAKAKNWHTPSIDPNGMSINFTVERGVIMKNTTTWQRAMK